LGLQMRDYVVCGSSARCVATLLAFKRVRVVPVSPMGRSLAQSDANSLNSRLSNLILPLWAPPFPVT
jgi:hypothetical protein